MTMRRAERPILLSRHLAAALVLASFAGTAGGTAASVGSSDDDVLPPPAGLEELSPGLLSNVQAGVPDSWFPLDLDPAIVDDPDLAGDIDPFRGLLMCPAGVVRDDVAPWIARRFSSLDAPLDNGLQSLEIAMELETADEFAADVARLAECTVGDQATLVLAPGSVMVPDGDVARVVDATFVLVRSEATDDVPFPTVHQAVWAHDGGFSVMIVFGGGSAETGEADANADDGADAGGTEGGWIEGVAALAGVTLATLQHAA